MINEFEELNKFQSYIGKEIWVYHPGVGPDMYNGTAECCDPEVTIAIIDRIVISLNSVRIEHHYPDYDDFYNSAHIERCFLTKEEAEAYMQKQIDDGTAWW